MDVKEHKDQWKSNLQLSEDDVAEILKEANGRVPATAHTLDDLYATGADIDIPREKIDAILAKKYARTQHPLEDLTRYTTNPTPELIHDLLVDIFQTTLEDIAKPKKHRITVDTRQTRQSHYFKADRRENAMSAWKELNSEFDVQKGDISAIRHARVTMLEISCRTLFTTKTIASLNLLTTRGGLYEYQKWNYSMSDWENTAPQSDIDSRYPSSRSVTVKCCPEGITTYADAITSIINKYRAHIDKTETTVIK